jgi:prepilin signal peptidase PulO-like enzyme (type II secretory pathway)
MTYTIVAYLVGKLSSYGIKEDDWGIFSLIRFIMGMVMHMSLVDSSRVGLNMMKFVMKHPNRFNAPYFCFWLGLLKFLIVVVIEMCNALYMFY